MGEGRKAACLYESKLASCNWNEFTVKSRDEEDEEEDFRSQMDRRADLKKPLLVIGIFEEAVRIGRLRKSEGREDKLEETVADYRSLLRRNDRYEEKDLRSRVRREISLKRPLQVIGVFEDANKDRKRRKTSKVGRKRR
ncbi:hypothetical protein TWF281_002760 [Arthrobotrys megalospora]